MRTAVARNLSNMLTHMREREREKERERERERERETDRQTEICLGDRGTRKFDEKRSGRVFKHTQGLTRDHSEIYNVIHRTRDKR